jgi:hypothetical protein
MGVIVNDSLVLKNGITVDSYYASLDKHIVVRSETQNDTLPQLATMIKKTYILSGNFNIWVSKGAKEAGNPTIESKHITLIYDESPTGNIYDLLYSEFKKDLSSFQDDP